MKKALTFKCRRTNEAESSGEGMLQILQKMAIKICCSEVNFVIKKF